MKAEWLPRRPPEAPEDLEIIVPYITWMKMREYVRQCPTEIGWYGIVKQEGYRFTIEDVLLVSQIVTGTTTNMTADAIFELAEQFEREGRSDDLDNIRFWGHSHVNMGVSPSGTDIDTLMSYDEDGVTFFIAAIFNKGGQYRFDVALFDGEYEGVKFTDVPVNVPDDPYHELRESVQAEIKTHVTTRVSSTPTKNDSKSTTSKAAPTTSYGAKSKNAIKKEKRPYVKRADGGVIYKDEKGHWRNSLTGEIVLSSQKIEEFRKDFAADAREIDNLVMKQLASGELIQT